MLIGTPSIMVHLEASIIAKLLLSLQKLKQAALKDLIEAEDNLRRPISQPVSHAAGSMIVSLFKTF